MTGEGTTRFIQAYRPSPTVYWVGNHAIVHSAFEDAPVLKKADLAIFDTPALDSDCSVEEYSTWISGIFSHLDSYITDDAGLILFPRDRKGHPFLKSVVTAAAAQNHRWEIFRQYIWIRGGDYHRARYSFCPIFAFRRGKRSTISTSPVRYKDIIRVPNLPTGNESVVGEIPLEVLEPLILLFARETSVVLDPFAGSGSTGKACQRLGFQSISIELDPGRIEKIRGRLTC